MKTNDNAVKERGGGGGKDYRNIKTKNSRNSDRSEGLQLQPSFTVQV